MSAAKTVHPEPHTPASKAQTRNPQPQWEEEEGEEEEGVDKTCKRFSRRKRGGEVLIKDLKK